MRLLELFDQTGADLGDRLKQSALDLLTPLVANKVPFVTVDQVIDMLRDTRPGLMIDRSLVMSVLDPDSIKAVKKIDGDRIYLQQPENDDHSVDVDQAEKDKQTVMKKGQNAAKKAAVDKPAGGADTTPPPPKNSDGFPT